MLKKVNCSTLRGDVMPLVNFSPGSALMEINNTRDRLLNPNGVQTSHQFLS
jgi:hypothetical protein